MILFSHFYFEIELFCHLSVFCSDDEVIFVRYFFLFLKKVVIICSWFVLTRQEPVAGTTKNREI